jgi:hypothetical protein
MNPAERFPCPCCGYLVFIDPPGSHHVCPICCWEDDMAQLRFAQMPGGANTESLERAQRNFAEFGASSRRARVVARSPLAEEPRDPQWRPLDPRTDNVEEPRRGTPYGDSYPVKDPTVLYYWRSSYWRRYTS